MNYKAFPIAILAVTGGIALASEKPVQMSELPAAVRQAVQKETKGATIRGLSKETENGKTYYEAETMVNGRHRDLLFNASGSVAEIEDQTEISNIPAPARHAIEQFAAGGKVLTVEAVNSNGATSYEAQVRKSSGKRAEVKVSPEGKIVK